MDMYKDSMLEELKAYNLTEMLTDVTAHAEMQAITSGANTLVVVEVKTRTGEEYQQPEEAVTRGKMRNLAIAANAYVKECQVDKELRFDVISIWLMLTPMPKMQRLMPLESMEVSISVPLIFLSFQYTSLGHFSVMPSV